MRRFLVYFVVFVLAAAATLTPAPSGNTSDAGSDPGEFRGIYLALLNAEDADEHDQIISLGQQALKRQPLLKSWEFRESRAKVAGHIYASLGNAYLHRVNGSRAENIELAIEAFQAALENLTREALPLEWAETQDNLGIAYVYRINGNRAQNIELAIEACAAALAVLTREARPREWAQPQNSLDNAYRDRINGSTVENVQPAIKPYEATLIILTREAVLQDWAETQSNLDAAFEDRIIGSGAETIEWAIGTYAAAREVRIRQALPGQWADTQNTLGVAYRNRINGNPAENIDLAIKAFEAALAVRTPQTSDWAATQTNLGNAYQTRINGNPAENIERAIKAHKAALEVFARQKTLLSRWADTQNNLGIAYRHRVNGDQAENIELAIKSFEAVLEVITPQTSDWAETQSNLGNAYVDRINGSRAENIERAIKAHKAALEVFARQKTLLSSWAHTQTNLGVAYRDRIIGGRADNIERAIHAFEAALTVLTRKDRKDWAQAQNNLGLAYVDRIYGDRAENRERAIKAYEAALEVFTREALPREWADIQNNLGLAYENRIEGSGAENLERAIKAFEAALEVRTLEALPRNNFWTNVALGNLLFRNHDWAAASAAYQDAQEAFLILFGEGLDEGDARNVIKEAGSLFPNAAYAAVETNKVEEALTLLNQGKARLLAVALRDQSLPLTPVQESHRQKLSEEIRRLRPLTEKAGEEGARAILRVSEFRRELGDLVKEGLSKEQESRPGTLARAGALIPEGGAIVAPIVTSVGSKILIVTHHSAEPMITVVDMPDLTKQRLQEKLGSPRLQLGELSKHPVQWKASGYFGALNLQYLTEPEYVRARIGEWYDAIEAVGPDLWALFIGEINKKLKELGIKKDAHVVVLPTGFLGLLPIGLAQDPATGERFGDRYELTIAPSLEALASAVRVIQAKQEPWLAIVVNPSLYKVDDRYVDDSYFSEVKALIIQAMFAKLFADKSPVRLDKSNAETDRMLAALKNKTYWHFATHGFYNWKNPSQSGLKGRDPDHNLTIGALLDQESGPGKPRLVVMAACESGLYDTQSTADEFFGLPASFMHLGTAGVVSTLWQVDDLATALLMIKFYDLHLKSKLDPPAALRQAQAWLTEATKAALIDYIQAAVAEAGLDQKYFETIRDTLIAEPPGDNNTCFAASARLRQGKTPRGQQADPAPGDMTSHPFEHPYCWGGFVYTGL